MKELIFAVMITLVPAVSTAGPPRFDWPSTAALVIGQALDTGATLATPHCQELNSTLGPTPTPAKVLAFKAGSTAGLMGLQWLIFRMADRMGEDRRAARWIGKALGYFGGTLGAIDAVHNFRVCPRGM